MGSSQPGGWARAQPKDPQPSSFRTQHSWLSGGGIALDVASQDPLTRPARLAKRQAIAGLFAVLSCLSGGSQDPLTYQVDGGCVVVAVADADRLPWRLTRASNWDFCSPPCRQMESPVF